MFCIAQQLCLRLTSGTSEFMLAAAGRTQGSPKYTLQYSSSPFGFAVSRSDGSSNVPLFNTAGKRLVFKVSSK